MAHFPATTIKFASFLVLLFVELQNHAEGGAEEARLHMETLL